VPLRQELEAPVASSYRHLQLFLVPEFQPIVRNPHALTVLGNYWPRKIDILRFPPRRVEYKIDASTRILAYRHEPQGTSRGNVVFIHGLEGSADAGYIQSFSQAALLRNFSIYRVNLRTCGGTEDFCETMYHSGLTSDSREIACRIAQETRKPVFLVGFSLGGNVALKLAGELGHSDVLAGVCAISTPIELATCVRALDRPPNYLYARRFLDRLRDRVRRKSKLTRDLYTEDGLDELKTIWEFDDRITARLFGFGTAANYYATQSAARYLDTIRVPTLVVTAKDDPLVPFEIYGHPAFQNNPAICLIATEFGGHLGFISRRRPRFWVDHVALDWMERVLRAGQGHGTTQEELAYLKVTRG
jgi:predicted alpha/beta-fold hydrolase